VECKLASVGVARTKRSSYGDALVSLDAAISRRSRADALTAGNRLSRVVTDIMADYPTKVPAEVVYMDVAGRDVLYAAAVKIAQLQRAVVSRARDRATSLAQALLASFISHPRTLSENQQTARRRENQSPTAYREGVAGE
jgi:hypothetical protein